MEDFTLLRVDTPPSISIEGVAFATSANVGSGKVAPSTEDVPVAASANVEFSEKVAPSMEGPGGFCRLKMLHFSVARDDPGLGSPSDSSLLLQLRTSVTSTAESPWCLTNETTISNNKESGDSAGPSPFFLALKKSEQVRRLEFAAAAWDAMGRRFQERNRLT